MKADVLSQTDLVFLSEISVLIFSTVFVGAFLWIFRPGAARTYGECAELPLDDDTVPAGEAAR